MAVRITYEEETPGVLIEYSCVVESRELLDVVAGLFSDPRFPSLRYWISDRTSCQRFDSSVSDAQRVAKMTRDAAVRNPRLVMAQVSPNDLDFGMSRMFGMLMGEDGFRSRVFRTREDAELWVAEQLAADVTT